MPIFVYVYLYIYMCVLIYANVRPCPYQDACIHIVSVSVAPSLSLSNSIHLHLNVYLFNLCLNLRVYVFRCFCFGARQDALRRAGTKREKELLRPQTTVTACLYHTCPRQNEQLTKKPSVDSKIFPFTRKHFFTCTSCVVRRRREHHSQTERVHAKTITSQSRAGQEKGEGQKERMGAKAVW